MKHRRFFAAGLIQFVACFGLWLVIPQASEWFAGVHAWRTGSVIYLLAGAALWIWSNQASPGCPTRLEKFTHILKNASIETWAALLLAGIGIIAWLALPPLVGRPGELRRMLLLTLPMCAWLGLAGIEWLAWIWIREGRFPVLRIRLNDLKKWIRQVISLDVLAVGLILVLAFLLVLPSAPVSEYRYPGNDSAIYAYSGWKIYQGGVPYLDFWDHKPPLVYYVNALGLLAGADSFWGIWCMEVLSIGLAGLFTWNALKHVFSRAITLMTVAIGMINLYPVLEGGNLTEQYALVFQGLALLLLTQTFREKRGFIPYFWIGICGGLSFLFRQNLIGLWVVMGVLWFIQAAVGRQHQGWLRLAGLVSGFLLPVLASTAWFLAQNALGDYWFAAFGFNFAYSEASPGERLLAIFRNLGIFFRISTFFMLALLLWVASLVRAVGRHPRLNLEGVENFFLVLALVDFPLEIFLANLSIRNFLHYYISLWPSLIFLFAFGLQLVASKIKLVNPLVCRSAAIVFCALFFIQAGLPIAADLPVISEETYTRTVQLIRQESQGEEPILVWGGETQVYFKLRRSAATRYFFTPHIFASLSLTDKVAKRFISEINSLPPLIVVDTRNSATPLPTITEGGECLDSPADQVPALEPFFNYFCTNYRPIETIGNQNWIVYRLIQTP